MQTAPIETPAPPQPALDGRRRSAKAFAATLSSLGAELGRAPTAAERLQLQSAAALALQRDALLEEAAAGHEIDALALATVAAELRHALTGLGLPCVRRAA